MKLSTLSNLLAVLLLLVLVSIANAQSGAQLPYQAPLGILVSGTIPQNGTSAVQQFTVSTVAAATIQFGFKGATSNLVLTGTENNTLIASKATTTLTALRTTGTNVAVAVSGTAARVIQVTFQGSLGKQVQPLIDTTVTAGTLTVTGTTSTPGVTADGLTADKGRLLIDKGDSYLYINNGVPFAPSWVKVGP